MCDVVMWATALIVQSRGAGRVGVEKSCWPGMCLSLLVCVLHLVSSTHIVCVEVEDSGLCVIVFHFSSIVRCVHFCSPLPHRVMSGRSQGSPAQDLRGNWPACAQVHVADERSVCAHRLSAANARGSALCAPGLSMQIASCAIIMA
jgi:hypothetical protein